MIPAVLSVIKNEPGLAVIYFLIPAFYPLIVWLYRDVQVRTQNGVSMSLRAGMSSTELMSVLAAASVGAGLIHAAVAHPHYVDGLVTQLFFVITAVLQLAWAWMLFRRPDKYVLIGGAVLNAVIVLIWMQSRRAGLPIGPTPNQPEAVGFSDVVASLLEVVVVFGCIRLLKTRPIANTSLVSGRLLAPSACIAIIAFSLVAFAVGGHH